MIKFLVFRGWSTWEERQTKGARREEDVAPFMTGPKRVVPASYLANVGEPRLFGARHVKILLPITPWMAWELRGVLTEAIQEHGGSANGAAAIFYLDDPGPIGHRLWGKWYDQTGIFYVDNQGIRRLAVFGFRHAATWMHFNLNLVSAKNGIWF